MKPPEPLYPCHFCNEEFSWPASDLHWSNRFSDWVCGECWCGSCYDDDYEQDEIGVRLSDYLKDTTEQELATLRAKAETYDKGKDVWAVYSPQGILQANTVAHNQPQSINRHAVSMYDTWSKREAMGYTCRKVRVVEEVENV
jgi:hypothetical protein